MSQSEGVRRFKSIVTWVIALIIISFAFVGIIFFKRLSKVQDGSDFIISDYGDCQRFVD